MFLSEWCEFPSALCLAGGGKQQQQQQQQQLDESLRLDVVEIARP